MSYNETNTTYENVDNWGYSFRIIVYIYTAILIFIIIVGTLLNLWFLVAILVSRDLRSRLRNKIICNSLIAHLVETTIILPVYLKYWTGYYDNNCVWWSLLSNLQLIIDFITNWLLVMLIVVFIAQIQDFNPSTKLTPRAVTVCTIGLLVFPWVASLVIVPIIVHEYYHREEWAQKGCSHATLDSMAIFKSVDTVAPIILAAPLVILAAGLKYRRSTRGYTSDSMQTELISRGPEIDNIFAYVAAVVASTICDILEAVYYLDESLFSTYDIYTWYALSITFITLSNSRFVLLPLVWLLLADVRQHIKAWRPWYRADLGIDLTMTYLKDET